MIASQTLFEKVESEVIFSNLNFFFLVNYKLFWYKALLCKSNILKNMRIQSFQNFKALNLMWPQAYVNLPTFSIKILSVMQKIYF
jgi:hypothetical protein